MDAFAAPSLSSNAATNALDSMYRIACTPDAIERERLGGDLRFVTIAVNPGSRRTARQPNAGTASQRIAIFLRRAYDP
jgi:hypothetical protein